MPPTDFSAELAELERAGRRRRLRCIDGAQERELVVDGRAVLNFSSNNYLGLANSPVLRAAAAAELDRLGTGAGASRLIVGNLGPHRELERELAEAHQCEAALLFNSGYNANVGVLQAIAGPGDFIYSDEFNHASIIDGCRLSRATVRVYPHGNAAALAGVMERDGVRGRRRIVVSDSVFSMDGDRAPVRALAEVARRHSALLMMDEAHATGAIGPRGRGLAAEVDVVPDVHVGTMGKAYGSFGAFVVGRRDLVELLINRARSFVFTTALPPAVVAANRAALTLIGSAQGDALRQALARNGSRLASGLRSLGIPQIHENTHIFPIIVGSERRAMTCAEQLLRAGIYAQGIRPPTVPEGTSRMRFAVMATHTGADIDRALEAVADLGRRGLLKRTAA